MGSEPTSLAAPGAPGRSGPRAFDVPTAGAGASGQASTLGPSSFAGHYGQLIISEGIAPIPRALYLYQGALNLSPQQVWFISYVLAHKWDGDLPHPRLQELARHATLGLRQIKKIKNRIAQAGFMEVTPRYGSGGEQDANGYDFGPLLDRLERLITTDPGAAIDELAERSPAHEEAATEKDQAAGVSHEQPQPDRSFAARYGRVVLRRGVAAVPRAIFTYQAELGISPQQMWFIVYILSFQWSTELPYPSLRKMAQNTGYSERQIHRIKDGLVSAGYLRVVERGGVDGVDGSDHANTTSAYDFTELLKTLTALIRKYSSRATGNGRGNGRGAKEEKLGGIEDGIGPPLPEANSRAPHQPPLEPATAGGELHVSGGMTCTSEGGEPCVSGGVNPMSEGGVNRASEGRVNCTSYEIESIKEESDKEESHQQQHAESDENDEAREAQENAYYALVDVGVFPGTALEISQQADPDHIDGWVRYYLSVLSGQDNLSNPLGVLVSKLRSGEEPPCLPSSADLHSLRLQYSRYNSHNSYTQGNQG